MPVRVRSTFVMAIVLAGMMALILAFGAKPAQANEAVVSEARGYMGAAYDYSGVGWGYDCSEFTSVVFSKFGVSLADNPAIAREEVRDFDDPLVEIKMESNYKSAATLVGGYANAIAGMSIANVASQFENEEYVQDGIAVNASKKFILNGTPLGFISTTSDLTNERNIAGIVRSKHPAVWWIALLFVLLPGTALAAGGETRDFTAH